VVVASLVALDEDDEVLAEEARTAEAEVEPLTCTLVPTTAQS
jgi:hypothetical protein